MKRKTDLKKLFLPVALATGIVAPGFAQEAPLPATRLPAAQLPAIHPPAAQLPAAHLYTTPTGVDAPQQLELSLEQAVDGAGGDWTGAMKMPKPRLGIDYSILTHTTLEEQYGFQPLVRTEARQRAIDQVASDLGTAFLETHPQLVPVLPLIVRAIDTLNESIQNHSPALSSQRYALSTGVHLHFNRGEPLSIALALKRLEGEGGGRYRSILSLEFSQRRVRANYPLLRGRLSIDVSATYSRRWQVVEEYQLTSTPLRQREGFSGAVRLSIPLSRQ